MRTESRGFNITAAVRDVAADMIGRLPELDHIDLTRVCFAFTSAKSRSPYGIQASLTPLRFEGGALEGKKRGRRYRVQRVLDRDGRDMLYIFTVCLPRFMDLEFREKLITIVHELWHIGPQFDGDIRRHPGRCFAHSASQKEYDAVMAVLADRWLALAPPEPLYAFLKQDYDSLHRQHGSIFGMRVAKPKLIPVAQVSNLP